MISFLLINDEWLPMTGGISVFNRELATGLARQGHRVSCLVPSPDPAELTDARSRKVRLMAAEETPAGPELLVPTPEALRYRPDVVVGHDRISGVAAWTYARRYLNTQLVHIVHTAPSEIERYKATGEATLRIEERERTTRRIARDADIVAAVGPRLARLTASAVFETAGAIPVLRLDPGMTSTISSRTPPGTPLVLVLGRTEDIAVKGLDIAVRAVGGLPCRPDRPRPALLIRGAPTPACDGLHAMLLNGTGLSAGRLDVRPFTGEFGEIMRDLARVTVALMPSRVEGLGLSSLEAIGAGTPVLISARSGLSELLYELLGTLADPMIVDVVDDLEHDTSTWAAAIQRVLDDPARSFAYAAEVRHKLARQLTWQATASALIDQLISLRNGM